MSDKKNNSKEENDAENSVTNKQQSKEVVDANAETTSNSDKKKLTKEEEEKKLQAEQDKEDEQKNEIANKKLEEERKENEKAKKAVQTEDNAESGEKKSANYSIEEEKFKSKVSIEDKTDKAIADDSKNIWDVLKVFFTELFDISGETDRASTIDDIKAGIDMKGQNAWVLIFSILIASTGLNTGSAAVVIGAMLISPLMGPILGVGLALGINDITLLKKAFKNFLVMVILSIITSFLFFSIPLFQNETSEIVARTYPTVLDVIIALSGGMALIVALSRNNKSVNTIAGVAIATALMPPLCTAGYGLATGNWAYFGGALFLFTINTIFIATATFSIVKFLHFPMKEYANASKRKNISRAVYTVVALVIIPSTFMFYKLYQKSDFKQKVEATLADVEKEKGIGIFDIRANLAGKTVSFAVLGKSLMKAEIDKIEEKIKDLGYKDIHLLIIQDEQNVNNINRIKQIEESYLSTQQLLALKDNQIAEKEKAIIELQRDIALQENLPFQDLLEEIKAFEPNLDNVSYQRHYVSNFKNTDTLRIIKMKFNKSLQKNKRLESQKRMGNWLQKRVKGDSLQVIFE